MLKLQVDVFVRDESYRVTKNATASIDVAEQRIDSLGFYASSLASILGDTMAVEIGKALGIATKDGEDDDTGE